MIRWYSKLYKSNKDLDIHKINWNISHNAGMAEVYFIVLSKRDDELMLIYPFFMMMQDRLKEEELFTVGIARGYLHAERLVKEIIEDIYNKTGGFDVKGYFKEDF